MDLELTADQEFFRDTTRRFLEAEMSLPAVRALADHPDGFERSWWAQGAELGWTSMLVPEAYGGGSLAGDGLLDLALVAEEMGRLVSPGPLLPTSVAVTALSAPGSEAVAGEVLAKIVAGELVATVAFDEPGRPWAPANPTLVAAARPGGFVLNGTKVNVEAGAQADWVVVTALLDGEPAQFALATSTPGVTAMPQTSIDLVKRYAKLTFTDVEVPQSARLANGAAEIDRQVQVALVLQNAETNGAIARVFEFTTEYAGDRYSFGRPLASYQALKHRFADMKLWLEACHATHTASARAVQTGAPNASELVSVAKHYIGEHATEIVQDCVQMHGGIGVTWEHDIHLYLRRVSLNRALYGAPSDHADRLAVIIGL